MIKKPEQRDSERKPFNFPVHFHLFAVNSKQKTGVQCVGRGVDISKYGLGLITELSLEKGAVLQVMLPAIDDIAVPVFAEVRWSMPFNSYRVGLQFLGL